MISKIGPEAKPARELAEIPGFIRSAIGFTTRALSSWKSRHAPPPTETPAPEPEPELTFDEILAQLGSEQIDLRQIRCQFGTIEHLVLSKEHGFLLLETKAHPGRVAVVDSKIRINGTLPEEDFVAEALHTTYWLVEELRAFTGLSADVTPLIVFTEASMEESRELKGVTITGREHLLKVIEEKGTPMPPALWEMREKIAHALVPPAVG